TAPITRISVPRMGLKDTEIRGSEKNYRKADSGGLFLEVFPYGTELWCWKFRVGVKEMRRPVDASCSGNAGGG
ncbi:MAG TPA: hypothetical protein VK913_04700, partial [Erythrobacter sp.]|nr:hypothetical protein [Erythrobacter sp.]